MARENYNLQLKELKERVTILGVQVENTIREAVRALINKDIESAKRISESDNEIDEQEHNIERLCYQLLLRQQPVAGDLRAVSAALKMVTDMERIGDHAQDISELTILMENIPYPSLIRQIEAMSNETSVMLIEAVDAFSQEDVEKAKLVILRDDTVDELFLKVKSEIETSIKNGESVDAALDLLMVAKYFERIGDHATNIAEWVIFSVMG